MVSGNGVGCSLEETKKLCVILFTIAIIGDEVRKRKDLLIVLEDYVRNY